MDNRDELILQADRQKDAEADGNKAMTAKVATTLRAWRNLLKGDASAT